MLRKINLGIAILILTTSCGGGGGKSTLPTLLACDMNKESVRFMCFEMKASGVPTLSLEEKAEGCAEFKNGLTLSNPEAGYEGFNFEVQASCPAEGRVKQCSVRQDNAEVVFSIYNLPLEAAEEICAQMRK